MIIKGIELEFIKGEMSSIKAGMIVKPITAKLINEKIIRDAAFNALKLAKERKIKIVAMPSLGASVGGFDYAASAKIMSQEVFRLMRENKNISIAKIIFVLPNDKIRSIFEKTIFSYISYISKKLEEGPFITVDIIIEVSGKVVIIERSNPPFGWAIPGGFVDYGESLEEAALREAKEETSLDVSQLKQLHTYSKYGRDPRFHTVTCVFTAKGKGTPRADSDAKNIRIVSEDELGKQEFAFDHKKILKEYFKCQKKS